MKKISVLLFILFLISACSVYQTIVNLSRLEFKLGKVNNFEINGVNISEKNSYGDFNLQEIMQLTTMFTSGSFPVSFVLNVEARNPNDGTGGFSRTDANIKSFPWRLLIDGKETITGNIASPVFVPGTGESTLFPILIQFDLIKYFEDRGYESLINLALNLGGKSGNSSKLTLYANPVIGTSLGDISYPGELKIIDASFSK